MGIPVISSYALPTENDLPEQLVQWQPDPVRAALLIHDMQQYFVDFFPSDTAPISGVIGNIAALRKTASELGIPVIYTAQPGNMTRHQRGLLQDFWGPGMRATPEHRRVIKELTPRDHDVVLTKWRYSAFTRTHLTDLMAGQRRDQLIVCGIYAHVGCLMTVADAFAQDIQPFLVADAIADFTREDHLAALEYAARRCAATPTTTTVLTALHAQQNFAVQH
ncbi:isochorismatase [Kibdelosporangium aridum]|uniref:Isochorismatase n=1 Tax=Kibdelosporangium aridum TaxID=2030 RepID=A0A428YC56_KIBAR|nr:isochorismatase family protein [Kibdelosporangium aridum]RSM65246.1 isochorismatase [Kibdelosporangium aridum]